MRLLLILTFFAFSSSMLFIIPITPVEAGLIPCGLTVDDTNQDGDQTVKCTLCHLVVGVNSIIVWLRNIMSAFAIAFIVAMAFIYITSAGDEGRMRFAKGGIVAALIGFTIILLAWVIVNFILSIKDSSGTSIFNPNVIRADWDSFECSTTSQAQ